MAVRWLAGAAVCFLISATFLFVRLVRLVRRIFLFRATLDSVHRDLDYHLRDTYREEEQSFFPVYPVSVFHWLDSALHLPVYRLREIVLVLRASSLAVLDLPVLTFRRDLRPSAYLADHAIPVSGDHHTFVVHLPVLARRDEEVVPESAEQSD